MSANLFRRLKAQWGELAASQPGKRFQERYHRRLQQQRGPLMQALSFAAGLALLIAGVIMLFIPGPGSLAMLVGAELLVERSLGAARTLDCLELKLRRMAQWVRRAWRVAEK